MAKITKKKMPMVILNGLTVMPGMIVHFDLNNKDSVAVIEKSMLKGQYLLLMASKDQENVITEENLYEIGTVAKVRQMIKLPENTIRILVEGFDRGRLLEYDDSEGFYEATVEIVKKPEPSKESDEINHLTAMVRTLRDLLTEYINNNPRLKKTLEGHFTKSTNLSDLLDQIAANIPIPQLDKLKLLQITDVEERFMVLSAILSKEIDVINIKKDLGKKIHEKVEKNQREYVLREQLAYIKKELSGGSESEISDADMYREKVSKLKAKDEVKEKLLKEIKRFEMIPDNSSENSVLRGYIETLLELPWDKTSKDIVDIKKAEEILDKDHYGLKKVKERVTEFLAVRALTKKGDSPIICLVGPPGTGKTSIAKSVAKALNKKYVRICLGGVRDEAEIRGHRKTYVGAMPGRIANALKTAGVKNPLILLDEIDKISSDYKGDTSSALLEVLDSEQNDKFRDHYVELPLDLSEVLFIATANDINNIKGPLRDRMEVIEVTSYTENEKFHIAKEHLLKKTLKANGLTASKFLIKDEAIKKLISGYTKEAGVRGLERRLSELCRKAAKIILKGEAKKVTVTESNLKDFLGNEKYQADKTNEKDEVGIVRGLAWTSVGGDTLEIEVNVMPGKGDIMLTGQMGDVMKESATTGMSYIRSIANDHKISKSVFKDHDFHIHIPEGAVPKDGPSAGITMATAVFSAITGKEVRCDVAMTGEITLRGRVLPIGGLKEKILAAKLAGVKTVIVPDKNRKDIEEIDEEIKEGLEILFVEHMNEVLKIALR